VVSVMTSREPTDAEWRAYEAARTTECVGCGRDIPFGQVRCGECAGALTDAEIDEIIEYPAGRREA